MGANGSSQTTLSSAPGSSVELDPDLAKWRTIAKFALSSGAAQVVRRVRYMTGFSSFPKGINTSNSFLIWRDSIRSAASPAGLEGVLEPRQLLTAPDESPFSEHWKGAGRGLLRRHCTQLLGGRRSLGFLLADHYVVELASK